MLSVLRKSSLLSRVQEQLRPLFKGWTFKALLLNKSLVNGVLFQLGWFACVLGGDVSALLATAGILLIHGRYFKVEKSEWQFIAIVTFIGLLVDSSLSFFQILQFQTASLFNTPFWLLCLWVLFALTLNHSLSWLQQRLFLAALLGGISGPMSYIAGSKLASVVIAQPLSLSLIILSLCWAFVMPLLVIILIRLKS